MAIRETAPVEPSPGTVAGGAGAARAVENPFAEGTQAAVAFSTCYQILDSIGDERHVGSLLRWLKGLPDERLRAEMLGNIPQDGAQGNCLPRILPGDPQLLREIVAALSRAFS